jgi:hypothetical protein
MAYKWQQIERLLAPKAFGEKVTGSTPVFSTKMRAECGSGERLYFALSIFCK